MTESKQTGMGFPTEYGGGGDIGASIAAFQTLAYSDLSLLVKAGVQFGLFGGAILHLGSERHHREHLADIIAGRTLGCFAMTETGHGSNVQALETTATYDAETDEFVIQTPTESGRKDYIGNAAEHGHLAVVFAQLVVGGEGHGVHALIVPIRDQRRHRPPRRHGRGRRPEARTEGRRQRPVVLRRCPGGAGGAARPVRRRRRDRYAT